MARFQTCPKCRALLTPGTKVCPYCDAGQDAALALSPDQDADATGRMGSWIVAACVVVYVLMVLLDPGRGDKQGNAFEPTNIGILTFGSHRPFFVQHCGQYWRVVSANFVHLDLLHLFMNCVAALMLIPLAGSTLMSAGTGRFDAGSSKSRPTGVGRSRPTGTGKSLAGCGRSSSMLGRPGGADWAC